MTTKHRLASEYVYLVMLRPDTAMEYAKGDNITAIGLFSDPELAETARDEHIRDIDNTLTNEDFLIYRMPIQTSRESINFSLDFWYL